MKKFILGLIATVFLVAPKGVLASCAVALGDVENKANADVVIVGVALDSGAESEIVVENIYKGDAGETVQVSGSESGGSIVTSVDFSFEEGTRYLLFLQKGEGGVFRTNICNGNRELVESLSNDEVLVLSEGGGVQEIVDTDDIRVQNQSSQNNNMIYIGVGVGLVVIGGLAFYFIKK